MNGSGTAVIQMPAQQQPVLEFDAEKIKLVRDTVAQGCTDTEFQLLLYQAKTYQLDPLRREIWAIKYDPARPASIFTGRDGFLKIAHASGQFDGMESGVREDVTGLVGWARVYRKDMSHPFSVEDHEQEYNSGRGQWQKMPRTMIQKVAESQALRRAFAISGIYSQEEDRHAMVDGGPVNHDTRPVSPVIDAESHPAPAPAPTGKKWTKVPPKIFDT